MGYQRAVYTKAARVLENRREDSIAKANQRHAEVARLHPDLIQIDRELSRIGLSIAKAMCTDEPEKQMDLLAQESLALQIERKALLKSAGLPETYLDIQYHCALCSDTGYLKEKLCPCQKEILAKTAFDEIAKVAPIYKSSFDQFNLSLYDDVTDSYGVNPNQRMQMVLDYCKQYASDFDAHSESLFLYGSTGLGKTHLSLAIAAEAIRKGFGVIYGSAQNLIGALENEHFGRGASPDYNEKALLSCDLLIIDDLGAEFTGQFAISAVYNIINTRLLADKPVIISTNLDIRGIQEKYTERVASRIIGSYTALRFFGSDMRQKLKIIGA